MKKMKQIVLVLAATVAVCGWGAVHPNSAALTEFHTGMTFGFVEPNGFFASKEARIAVDRMSANGIRWVCLVPTVWSEDRFSARQFRDSKYTPGDDELVGIIEYMHLRGLRVQLRPMLECHDGGTRATIFLPPDEKRLGCSFQRRSEWFRELEHRSVHYARLAERTGCELFCIDSELDLMTDCNAEWKSVLRAVRGVYSGPVTSCHTVWVTKPDKIEEHLMDRNHWFQDLDVLSLSVYMAAGPVTEEKAIREYLLKCKDFNPLRVQKWRQLFGKPIIFGEVGSSAQYPGGGGFKADAKYMPERQVEYMKAIFGLYLESGVVNGFYWWQWDDSFRTLDKPGMAADRGDPRNGFSLWDKPGLETLKGFYTKLNSCETAVTGKYDPGRCGLSAALPDERHAWAVHDRNRPNPPVVLAPEGGVPSDAIVLFDGSAKSVDENWCAQDGKPTKWRTSDGAFICVPGSGMVQTRRSFGDCQLHVEWQTPATLKGTGQARGNSGVIFMPGWYEVQVLDSWGTDPKNMTNPNYADGQAGAVYGQHPPLVNPTRPIGSWQSYDIIFHPPRYDGTVLVDPGSVTCFFNGVLVQDATPLEGPTTWRGRAVQRTSRPGKGPLLLQDHGNPVPYRNIWIREIPNRFADTAVGGPGTARAAVFAERDRIAERLFAKVDATRTTAENVTQALEVLAYANAPKYRAAAERLLVAWRKDAAAQKDGEGVKSVNATLRLLKAFGIEVK